MDRSTTSAPERAATVRTARRASLDLLSPAAAGERGEPASAPAARRAVLELPVFRQPSHGRHAGGQPQTHPAADAHSGHRSALPETEPEPPGSRSRDLPVPAARRLHRAAQPGLEHRYYVHSDAWRLPLPGCRDGLVQPLRAQLGTFQYDGDRILFGRAGGSVPFWQPEIWNSDQGAQFTSPDFLAPLKKRDISISMDGRGRALDNAFIERLWRSLKYELIYPGDFASGADLFQALDRYFRLYNHRRPHQALGYRTPADLFPHRTIRKRSSP